MWAFIDCGSSICIWIQQKKSICIWMDMTTAYICMHALIHEWMYEWGKARTVKSLVGAICCCLWGYRGSLSFSLWFSPCVSVMGYEWWGRVETDKVEIECCSAAVCLISVCSGSSADPSFAFAYLFILFQESPKHQICMFKGKEAVANIEKNKKIKKFFLFSFSSL